MGVITSVPKHYQEGIDPKTGLPVVKFLDPVEVTADSNDTNSYIYDDEEIDEHSKTLLSGIATQSKIIQNQSKIFADMVNALSKISKTLKNMTKTSSGEAGQKQAEAIKSVAEAGQKQADAIKSVAQSNAKQADAIRSSGQKQSEVVGKVVEAMNSLKTALSDIKVKSDGSVVSAVKSLKDSLDNIAGVKDEIAKISENGKEMVTIEKDRHKFETTAQNVKDLDGQVVANISPRDAQVINNASQARTATDTNNFELDSDDILGLFDDLPDISGLFNIELPGETLRKMMN